MFIHRYLIVFSIIASICLMPNLVYAEVQLNDGDNDVDFIEVGNIGVFIGANESAVKFGFIPTPPTRFNQAAQQLSQSFRENSVNSAAYTITGNIDNNTGISLSEISDVFSQIKQYIKPTDILTVYIGGHGNSDKNSKLSPINNGNGDEYITVGDRLYDNYLANELSQFSENKKIVFLDACHSGGFWGNNNLDVEDLGKSDLDKLSNIALFTAASEDSLTYLNSIHVGGVFSEALLQTFIDDEKWQDLSANELYTNLSNRINKQITNPLYDNTSKFYELEFGDEIPSDQLKNTLSLNSSQDFNIDNPIVGNISAVPEPSEFLLFSSGLAVLGLAVRRKKLINQI